MSKFTEQQIEQIARTAHEVNKTYCTFTGDDSQLSWNDCPEWQRKSCIVGVEEHLADPDKTPEDSHAIWMQFKLLEGWEYGQVKDPEKRTHPCLVPYAQLPPEQRAKDYLFLAVVNSFISQTVKTEVHADLDTEMEQDIVELNLNAPRVTLERIRELMSQVEYKVHVVEGTTTTQAVAVLDGFILATGSTSCVDPDNFNEKLGAKYAIYEAEYLAKDKLYELEGYRLKFANKD